MLNFRNSLVHRDSAAGHQQLPAGQHPDDQLTAAQLHMDILPGVADAQLGQGRHGGTGAGAAGPGLAAAAFPHRIFRWAASTTCTNSVLMRSGKLA